MGMRGSLLGMLGASLGFMIVNKDVIIKKDPNLTLVKSIGWIFFFGFLFQLD